MKIRTNNDSYKNRNRNKIKTLVGSDEVFMDILKLEFELEDGSKITVNDIFEKVYNEAEKEAKDVELLNNEIETLKSKNIELKRALKEYIETEKLIDTANTNSIEILSKELEKVNLSIKELNDKTKFL